MRRDLDLMRQLLLRLEICDTLPGIDAIVYPGKPPLDIDGYTEKQITYHLDQIIRSEFVDTAGSQQLDGGVGILCLTPAGHDYLDTVRDPEVWQKTKDRAEKAGGWTLGLIKDIGLALIKGELQKHGMPLL